VEGVIKAVYAKEGDTVDAVVERDGALVVVCPDELMKTQVAYKNTLVPGDAVTVTVGTASVNGVVLSVSGGKATVQFEDDGYAIGDNAVVTSASGDEIGSGVVAVANPVYVSAKGGIVDDVRVEVGDDVSRGGKLMTLEGEILSSSLYSLLEQRETLQDDLNDVISDIDNLSVRAGSDGVLTGLALKKGQPIQQGAALFTVQSNSTLKIDVEIDELDIASIETGDEATVTFDALPEKTFTANILKINPVGAAQNNVTKYTVTLSLENASGVMLGMSADVQIVSERVTDVLLIPVEAIQTINGEKFVVFEGDIDKDRDYTAATHKVVTGITDGVNIEVTEGLSEGDRVAVPQVKEDDLQMWGMNGGNRMNGGSSGGTEPSGSPSAE
jgi:multidrug efflux pump subunit AcrA (membrane-fusion protein)